ncbi:MAG: LytTR family transcriptional regulator [Eubacterium sp.]|nr:LytTR family transcriptional regulator [Eubacterium sp.]
MRIGLCADKKDDLQKYVDIINEQRLVTRKDTIKIFTPHQLLFDVEEGYFDIEILITDITFDGLSFSGIDISKIINEKYPLCQIIYSSVYVEYVDYTYESNYVYFIQKKNLGKLLGKALTKARSMYEQEAREKTFEFYSGRVKRYIHLKDIYYLEKNDRVVDVVTLDKIYKTTLSIKQACEKLKNSNIVRANGSIAVNVSHIKNYSGSYLIVEDLGKRIEVSPKYSEELSDTYISYIEK